MRMVHLITVAGLALAALCAPAEAQSLHTVRSGQTLASIARRHRVSVSDLAAANRMRPSELLRIGQELRVPARGVVFVRPGQTLTQIARAHDTTVEALARANRMRPTSPLRAGQRLVMPGFNATREVRPQDWGEPEQPGVVRVRTREGVVELRLVDELGRVSAEALRALGTLMDEADDDGETSAHLPDARLGLLLAAISDEFGGREMQIVSGFREVGGYTQETSRHVHGRAIDIRVRGVPHRAVWDYCRSVAFTGCGLYPRSTFVHVDVRESHNQWVDWSAPGQRPRYGTLRGPYTRRQRRSAARPRVGRQITEETAVPREVKVVRDDRRLVGSP
jgi:LysM repeat protein